MDVVSRLAAGLAQRLALLSIGAAALLYSAVHAQQPKFSADVNVVNILANVYDARGALVEGLSKSDFVLDEDGRQQSIRYFSRQTDLPLTVGLLVDTSGSMARVLDDERAASSVFFRQVIRPKHDRVFVMDFDEQVRIVQTLTSSRKQLDSALSHLEPDILHMPVRTSGEAFSPDGRSTALFDAIYLASEAVMKKQIGRKALIVISDGMDVNSEYKLSDAIAAAQRSDTLIYAIHIYDELVPAITVPLSPPVDGTDPSQTSSTALKWKKAQDDVLGQGRKALQQAARETGGTFFEVTNEWTVPKIFGRIEDELRSQYNLGYSPQEVAEGFHRIHLTTTRPGLAVQARDGYYAQKP